MISLVELFKGYGISESESMERWLRNRRWPRRILGEDRDGDSFGNMLSQYCVAAFDELREDRTSGGIHQFSALKRKGRIPSAAVGKALVTSARSTLVTRWIISYGASNRSSGGYFEHDFVRDIFAYRHLIDSGDLFILPSAVTNRDGEQSFDPERDSADLQLAARLNETRVATLAADRSLIDQILQRYRINHQLVIIEEIDLPQLDGVSLDTIVKLRQEAAHELESFQRAYHKAIQEQITNSIDLDFRRISRQINEDILAPSVKALHDKYRQTIGMYRSLATSTAFPPALTPVGQVILSGESLKALLNDLSFRSALFGATVTTIAALAANRAYRKRELRTLHDDEYYVLWLLSRKRRK
jgi:hypothetical protein